MANIDTPDSMVEHNLGLGSDLAPKPAEKVKEEATKKPVEEGKQLSSSTLKGFLRCLVITSKKFEQRKLAREALKKQFIKVKKDAMGKVPKERIEKNIEELNNKIKDVLDKEVTLMTAQEKESRVTDELNKRIIELQDEVDSARNERDSHQKFNKDRIKLLTDSMQGIKSKLDAMDERAQKIKEIEEKVKQGVRDNKVELGSIESKLKQMEDTYFKLRNEGKLDDSNLEKLKGKIDFLKAKSRIVNQKKITRY